MSKKAKRSVSELTRLAFLDAEMTQGSMAEAWSEGSTERAEALELLAEYRAYRLRRWGKTKFETTMEGATFVSVRELMNKPTAK